MELESRIQILDRLSKKWGQKVNPLVENFDDFCVCFDSEQIMQLVYMAMSEYSKQSSKNSRERNRDLYTDEKIEEMMIDRMKKKWAHCFIDDKLCQRPKNFEEELQHKIEGGKLMLTKIYWLESDNPNNPDDIFSFVKDSK